VPLDSTLINRWLAALDERHLANLTHSEVARALRALSSCYVERRGKLATGAALDSAGKRAAFALFYAPQHFIIVSQILAVVGGADSPPREVVDIGCGSGVAGAAWALHASARRVSGFDRNGWAVAEANWTYQQLGIEGRASRADADRIRFETPAGSAIVSAYTVNELADAVRQRLLARLLVAHRAGASLLVVEPIARRGVNWWTDWERAFVDASGRADEWRFAVELPPRQRLLAKAAGLDPRELTARSLFASRHATEVQKT
jgi:protein-L-isoaspartate O-methyltransferase